MNDRIWHYASLALRYLGYTIDLLYVLVRMVSPKYFRDTRKAKAVLHSLRQASELLDELNRAKKDRKFSPEEIARLRVEFEEALQSGQVLASFMR